MSHLNLNQNKAVHHTEGPLLVLAGAGSGKTRVVTYRIAHLIETGVDPNQILAVTFTNKAAAEMKHRISQLCHMQSQILSTTFHSLGAKMLRESIHFLGYQNTFAIYDEEDSEKLLKTCLEQLNLGGDKSFLKETRIYISNAKNSLLSPDDPNKDDILSQSYRLYQEKLKECNAVDFDDLLFLPVQILQNYEEARHFYQNRWRYVLIDEYQDTNHAQYTLAKILVEKHQNVFAVGDPDQSIYSWRGARYQNILNFENDFSNATVITLDQNYRSSNNILQAANALIGHNENRFEKKLWSDLGSGEPIGIYIAHNERQEADFVAKKIHKHASFDDIALDDIAIFYRTNAQSRTFEDALLARKIPYTIIGGISFYERKEVKDILSYLRMIVSNADLISFLRTLNIPKRGIGASSLDKIVEESVHHGVPILIFCEKLLEQPELVPTLKLGPKQKEGLKNYLRTIHSLRNQAKDLTLCELMKEILSQTNYLSYLAQDPETMEERKENIDELLGKAAEWEEDKEDASLVQFLEELSLRVPKPNEETGSTIKMMTLHNSKGLEFSTVFFVGLEEDLMPHINTKDDQETLQEERRLCYVGMTRAKKHLYLTAATYRYMWGTERLMRPSRFLKEIPLKYLRDC